MRTVDQLTGDLPLDLADWDLATVRYLVSNYDHEPGFFDFKEVLNAKGNGASAANDSLIRTVCSMANTDGGFIVFGVKDRGHTSADPTTRLVGIPTGDDHRADFGRKIHAIQPAIHFQSVPRLLTLDGEDSRGIFVVRVPISLRRPHMVTSTGIFYTRGPGGSARPMSYYEVRDQMLLTEERLQQVSLVRLKLAQLQEQCRDLLARQHSQALRDFDGRLETNGFEALLSIVCALLPSDQELLVKLLKVPTEAQSINRVLDRWHFNDYRGHRLQSDTPEAIAWMNQVHLRANDFIALCADCEFSLSCLFGSLSMAQSTPPSDDSASK